MINEPSEIGDLNKNEINRIDNQGEAIELDPKTIENLKNPTLLKELFFKNENKGFLNQLPEYNKYMEEGGNGNSLNFWFDSYMKKIKQDLIFKNLSSEAIQKIAKDQNDEDDFSQIQALNTNIKYYKLYMKVYEDFYSKNYEHLQILRLNYLINNIKSAKTRDTKLEVIRTSNKIADLFEKYLTYENETEKPQANLDNSIKIKKCPTFVLNILTSTIALFHNTSINHDVLLRCLDNLILEFKNNFPSPKPHNFSEILSNVSYDVISSIEENLNILLELISENIFRANADNSYNFKNGIFIRLFDILKYFKSQHFLISLLFLAKEFKFYYPKDRFEKSNFYKIFERENDLWRLLIGDDCINTELEKIKEAKNEMKLKLCEILEKFESFTNNDTIRLKIKIKNLSFNILSDDQRFYYIIIDSYLIKLEIQRNNENEIISTNSTEIIEFADKINLKKVNCILKGSFLFILIEYKKEYMYFIYDKENFNIISKFQFDITRILDAESTIQCCLNNNEYFFIFITDKLSTNDKNKFSQLKLIKIKAKYYDTNQLQTMNEIKNFIDSRKYSFDSFFMDGIPESEKSLFSYYELLFNRFLTDSSNLNSFYFYEDIIIFHESSNSLFKFKIELDKKNKNYMLSKLENYALKYNFILFPSFFYNIQKNTFIYFTKYIDDKTNNITINIDEFKSFATNPYPYNYLSKHFLKNQLTYESYLKEGKNKILERMNNIDKSSSESRVINILKSKFINKNKISEQREESLGGDSLDIDSRSKISQEFYLYTLYNYAKNIMLTSNSNIFNSNLRDQEALSLIKYLITPFTLSCDNNPFTFNLIYKYIFSQVKFNLTLENLLYLIILKNYLQNLVSLGIDIKNYLNLLNKDEKDKLLEVLKFLVFNLKNLILSSEDKTLEKDEKKLNTLFFNEYLDILQLFITQNFETTTDEFMSMIKASKKFDQKIKLVSFFSNILLNKKDFDFKIFFAFLINFEKDIIFGVDNISFGANLKNLIKYTDLISKFSTNFKMIFIKKFSHDISKIFNDEKNISMLLLDELLGIFTKELYDIIIEVISRKEEILFNKHNRNIFFEWAKTKSITFNISFLLIQIFITHLMNNKENNVKSKMSVLPYLYLQKIMNIYTSLEKVNSILLEHEKETDSSNINTEKEVLFYIDTEHPLNEKKTLIRKYRMDFYGEKLYMNFDILSSNQSNCEVKLSDEDIWGGIQDKIFSCNKNKSFPINIINYSISNGSNLHLYLDYKQESSAEIANKNDYFVNEYGLKMMITNKKPRESNFLNEIRKSVLYSINIIISENLATNLNQDQDKEHKNIKLVKNTILYNSLFNSKLFKYISLPDSQTFIKRENIGYINNIIQSINDEKLKLQTSTLLQRNNSSDEELDLIRTYSKEINSHKEKENHIQEYVNSIISHSENFYVSGINYLQKILSKKNAYLVNLGGKDVEPLVINLFAIILKYQNLITHYVEKYLHGIYNLECSKPSDSSDKLSTKHEIKHEDLQSIHKIENFDLYLKIWTECSKIRIWFLEKKMILAEDLEKNRINKDSMEFDYDKETLKMLSGLVLKSKFLLSIVNPPNGSNQENIHFCSDILESLLLYIKNVEISSEKIFQKIHIQNEIGIKRETGLILLNIYLNLISDENEEDLNELIYHFNKIVRQDKKVINLIDDLTGADFKVIERVKTQFHILIENLILRTLKLKSPSLISVMNTLIWKLKGRDYPVFNNLKFFDKFTEVYRRLSNDKNNNNSSKKYSFGKEEFNRQTLFEISDQIFEIYALQIFRRIGCTTIENKEQYPSLGLTRSISTINEDDNIKMMEFILNIINPNLENFLKFSEEKDSASNFANQIQSLKKLLTIIYKGFSSSKEVLIFISRIDPSIFVNLFKLFKDEKLSKSIDIRFLLIKIYSVFFKSISRIDEGVFNYIIKNSIQLEIEKNSIKFTYTDISINTNKSYFLILVDYLIEEIHHFRSDNNVESYCLMYELIDILKYFFSIDSEKYKNIFNQRMKSLITLDLDLVLIIIGNYPKTITLGSLVYIKSNQINETEGKEFDLKKETNFQCNYKPARVVAFDGSKLQDKSNPYEFDEDCENNFSFKIPEIIYCNNGNENIEYAYLILDESLCVDSIKNSSFKIIKEHVQNLIHENDNQKFSNNIISFIIENCLLSHILNSVILNDEIPFERKIMVYKYIYMLLNLDEKEETSQENKFSLKKLIIEEFLKNDKLYLILNAIHKNSMINYDSYENNNIKYDVHLNFTSLEALENEIQYEILNPNLSLATKVEFSENFSYNISHHENCIKISKNKKTTTIPILGTYNFDTSRKNIRPFYNILSHFSENENQRILYKNSIIFIDSEILKKNENIKLIFEVCKQNDIKYIVTDQINVSDLNKLFNEVNIELNEFPCILFINKLTYFSFVSYFFLIIEGNEIQNFYFKYNYMLNLKNSSESDCNHSDSVFEVTVEKENLDTESMIFFPEFEEENLIVKFEEDKFKQNRENKILQERLCKFNLPIKILMEKVISLICRRIILLISINIKNFQNYEKNNKIIEFFLSSLPTADLILIFRSMTLEYTYNLNFCYLELKNLTIKNLLRNLIASLNDTHPLGKTLFSYLLDLNSQNLNLQYLHRYNSKYYKNLLMKPTPTESDSLVDKNLQYESIETRIKIIEFILENKFNDVDEVNKRIFYKEFMSKICDLVFEASKISIENKATQMSHLQNILTNLLKISTNILYNEILSSNISNKSNSNPPQENSNSFINFYKNYKDTILPYEKIGNLSEICQPLISVKNIEKEIKNRITELTHICSFFFSYFEIILNSIFKLGMNFSDSLSHWMESNCSSNKTRIFEIFYTYLIYTKKFSKSNEDNLGFLTLLFYNQEKLKSLFDCLNEDLKDRKIVIENLYGCVYYKLNKINFDINEYSKIKISFDPSWAGDLKINNNLNPIFIVDNYKNLQEFVCKDEELTILKNSIQYTLNPHNNSLFYFTLPDLPKTFLYSFGKNDNHALACGGNIGENYNLPQLVLGLEEYSRIKTFKFGLSHLFVLDYDGTLYVAGINQGSSLENFKEPIPKLTSHNLFNKVAQGEGGVKNIYVNVYNSSIMITNSGKIYGCGTNIKGNLGKKIPVGESTNTPFEIDKLPEDSPVKHIALGFKNTLIILENGNAYTLGDNSFYQCGKSSDKTDVLDWCQLKLPVGYRKFIYASGGDFFFLLLIEDDVGKVKLFSIGCKDNGCSGVGDDKSWGLLLCRGVENIEFKYIATRNYSSAAITKDGQLYTWGHNITGCLGHGDSSPKVLKQPTLVEYFTDRDIIVENVSLGNFDMLINARKKDFRGNYIKTIYACGKRSAAIGLSAPTTNNNIFIREPFEITYFYDNNLVPIKAISCECQSFVLTFPSSEIKTIDNHVYASCKECKIVKLTKIVYIDLSQNFEESIDFTCKDCINEIKSSDPNFNGIYYTLTTPLQNQKIKVLLEYLKKIDITSMKNNLIKLDPIAKDQTLKSISKESNVYTCSDCMHHIHIDEILNISTENLDLILCSKCLINNSEKIIYPQVFYSFKNCYIHKLNLYQLPKFEFSEYLYDVPNLNNEISEVQLKEKSSSCYKIFIDSQTKLEKKLLKIHNSDKINKLEKIYRKVNSKILFEFSELKEEFLHTLNSGEEKYSINDILNFLKTLNESKFSEIRNLNKLYETEIKNNISYSHILFTMIDIILIKINEELQFIMNISTLTSDSILKNAISDNIVYISKKNRMKTFFKKLNSLGTTKNSSEKYTFDRFKARKFYDKNIPDTTGEETLFGQLHKKLENFEIKKFQTQKDSRLFSVVFTGEGASDAGGPYRDLFSSICQELQSSSLDILKKSPNCKGEIGAMRDKFILNPSATLSIHEQMYMTLGKLFGHALFSGNMLGLNLHPIIWKLLLNSEVKFYEFETVDKLFYNFITDLENNSNNVSKEEFEYVYDLNFTIQLSDGKEKDLISGGKTNQVSYENKEKFIILAKHQRINEFNLQVEWIRRGLIEVVPEYLFQLLTWRDIEELVCGKSTVNIEHLKKCTNYQGYTSTDQTISWFWDVFESFSDEEKVLYIKFVWGRTRLPDPDIFNYIHIIQKTSEEQPDRSMPQAATCFFTLNLPNFSKKEILAEKLRYAILNCSEIDGDFDVEPIE